MNEQNADARSIAKLGRLGTVFFGTIAGLLIAHILLLHTIHSKQYDSGSLRALVDKQSEDLRQIGRTAQAVLLYEEAGTANPTLLHSQRKIIRTLGAAVAKRDLEITRLFDGLNRPVEWVRMAPVEEQAYRSVMSNFLSRALELSSGTDTEIRRSWTLPDLAISPFGILMSHLKKLEESSYRFDARWRLIEFSAALVSFLVILILAGLLVFKYFRPLCARAQRDFRDLQESLSVRTRYFYQVSHELRTPLNVINGYSQMLSEAGAKADSDAGRYAASILQAGTVLTHRIDDILLLGELQAGIYERLDDMIDLAEVARSAVDSIIRHPEKIRVEDLRTADLPVRADRAAVRMILLQLLRNGTHHAVDRCILRLSEADGDQIIEIIDDGPGIDHEEMERVMKPFHTVANGEILADTGLGLGLAIVAGLARVNRIPIDVQTGPDQGTAFLIRFPPEGRSDTDASSEIDFEYSLSAHGLHPKWS